MPSNAFYPPANDEEKRATPSNHEGSAEELQRVVLSGNDSPVLRPEPSERAAFVQEEVADDA